MLTSMMDARAKLVESRVDMYLHSAKRIVMDQFGSTSEHSHNQITVDIAAAMVSLEAAHIIADAEQYG